MCVYKKIKWYSNLMTAPLFRYISDKPMWASYAYVGLAAPGGVGSWERDAMVKFTELLFVYTMI
jgi:hypothetical protein